MGVILVSIISFVAYGLISANNSIEKSKNSEALEESKKIQEFVSRQIEQCLGKNNQSEEICNDKIDQFTKSAKLVLGVQEHAGEGRADITGEEDRSGSEKTQSKITQSEKTPSNITPPKTAYPSPDSKNSFLEKFGELKNNREKVELEFNSEEKIDNEIWQVYDVIRIESDSSRSNVGFLMFSAPNGSVETIIFKIQHNFDIDVMGISLLLFEKIGKEYIYLWSDEACLDEKYDDRCFDDGYNNKHEHFLNGGADGLTWKVRADIISGVSVGVEREFREYFTANFHFIG